MSFGTALASTMGLGVAATTAAVGALVRDSSMPSSSLSETVTLRVLPTSAATGDYSLLPASSISAPERSHWYSNTASAMPSAEAMSLVDAVRVSPTWAVPVIVGVPVAGLLAPSTVVPVSVPEFLVGEDEGPGLFHVVQVDCDHGRIALPVRLRPEREQLQLLARLRPRPPAVVRVHEGREPVVERLVAPERPVDLHPPDDQPDHLVREAHQPAQVQAGPARRVVDRPRLRPRRALVLRLGQQHRPLQAVAPLVHGEGQE